MVVLSSTCYSKGFFCSTANQQPRLYSNLIRKHCCRKAIKKTTERTTGTPPPPSQKKKHMIRIYTPYSSFALLPDSTHGVHIRLVFRLDADACPRLLVGHSTGLHVL